MKAAYHRLLFPDGQMIEGPVVVETDAENRFLAWHPLQGEEPGTFWLGGTYTISEINNK